MDSLDVGTIRRELDINKTALIKALQEGNTRLIFELKTQRDNLKDMLIDLLETKAA